MMGRPLSLASEERLLMDTVSKLQCLFQQEQNMDNVIVIVNNQFPVRSEGSS